MIKRTVAFLILAISGCSESTAPPTGEPAPKKEVVEPPAIHVALAEGAEVFFDDRQIAIRDGRKALRIGENMLQQLLAEAERGNGPVQNLLGNLQGIGLTAHPLDLLPEKLCDWSERGFVAAYHHCARLLLTPTPGSNVSQEGLDRAMSYVRTLMGPKGPGSGAADVVFGDQKEECENSSTALICAPAWGALVTLFEGEIRLYQRIGEAGQLVRAAAKDGCNKHCEEQMLAFLTLPTEQMGTSHAQLWLIEALAIFLHLGESRPHVAELRSGIERVLSSSDVTPYAEFFRAAAACETDRRPDDCETAFREIYRHPELSKHKTWSLLASLSVSREEVIKRNCWIGRAELEAVLSRGQIASPPTFNIVTCLSTGQEGPADFDAAWKLARLSFIGNKYMVKTGLTRLDAVSATDAIGQRDLGLAYMVANLGGVSEIDAFGEAVETSRIAVVIGVDAARTLQKRGAAWVTFSESLDQQSKDLIGWLDYLGALPIALTDSGTGDLGDEPADERFKVGSGFFVSPIGHVLTNAHVVANCRAVKVGAEGTKASVLARDASNDLALLKVDQTSTPLYLDGTIARGTRISTIGFPVAPAGRLIVVTSGTVTALAGPEGDSRFFQLSAPVQPGNSGGPVVDEQGRVVGVVTSTADARRYFEATGALPQNMNYALKADTVKTFLESHIELSKRPLISRIVGSSVGEAESSAVSVECTL